MSDSTPTTAKSVQRALNWLVAATIVLYLILGGLSVYTYVTAHKLQDSVCNFNNDLQRRVTAGRQFLKEHPKGIAGIPAATLQQSIDNQQQTLDALDLDC